jgi:hypothetical protein
MLVMHPSISRDAITLFPYLISIFILGLDTDDIT